MSVAINRALPVEPPPLKAITLTDDLGDKLVFIPGFRPGSLDVRVELRAPRDAYVRVTAEDARALGESLVEWADGVEA